MCDEGWSGFNCTARLCPTGDDPRTPDQRNEVAHVACQADGGAFRLTFRGHTTTPIAHDAHYGDVEAVLDALPPIGIGGARVFLGNSTSATRVPTVCHRDYEVIARIEFLQAFGRLPALRVEPVALSLGGKAGRAKLAMITNFTLRCPACPGCRGALNLGYDGMETRRLAWYTNATELHEALEALPTLGGIASDFGNLTVAVTSDDAETEICDRAQAVNTTITLRGEYGNVYPLELVNEVYNDEPTDEPTNVTLVGTHGTKEDWPCSRRGVCDEALGLCRCFNRNMHIFKYEYKSSNGYDAPGPRGDCGYVAKEPISCPSIFQVCVCSAAARVERHDRSPILAIAVAVVVVVEEAALSLRNISSTPNPNSERGESARCDAIVCPQRPHPRASARHHPVRISILRVSMTLPILVKTCALRAPSATSEDGIMQRSREASSSRAPCRVDRLTSTRSPRVTRSLATAICGRAD